MSDGLRRWNLAMNADERGAVRVDKWLWAARFFKTRSLAQTAIERGRVTVGGDRIKVSRALHVGDRVRLEVGDSEREIVVRGLSEVRGPAPVAQALYEETEASVAARLAQAERRRLFREPATAIHGRPTKRDRRDLARYTQSDGEP